MLCELCGKRPAVVHVCEISNGKSRKLNLCLECVLSHAVPSGMNLQDVLKEMETKLPGMLLAGRTMADGRGERKSEAHFEKSGHDRKTAKCSECGTTYADYLKTGRVGCAHCYEVFSEDFNREFLVRQRSRIHIGKMPPFKPDGEQANINEKLRTEALSAMDLKKLILENDCNLKAAILREEYELAAKYRDAATALKRELRKTEESLRGGEE